MSYFKEDEYVKLLHSCVGSPIKQSDLSVNFSPHHNRVALPTQYEDRVVATWEKKCQDNPSLWNGSKFRLHSVATDNSGRCTLELGLTCYKDFMGTNYSSEADIYQQLGVQSHSNPQAYMADPLGVGAFLVTVDDHVVIMLRSMNVGESPGLYDVPGGHPEPEEIGGKVDFSDMELSLFTEDKIVEEIYGSILREIRDEVNIPLDNLSQPLLLGIAANKCGYGRPSSEFIVRTDLSSQEVENLYNAGSQAEADETTQIRLIPHTDISSLRDTQLWNQLSPSLKGCFMLYLNYHNQTSS